MKIRSSRWLMMAASPFALMAASPAFAQDATTTDAQAEPTASTQPNSADASAAEAAPTKEDTIVVTGFRAALRGATATKKRSDAIVEAVNAEDIGKLPDNGIGESIARLPGLSAQRAAGRANIISIRGFGPDFSITTLNGREQTTTNDSRAVEFDQFPSEILNQVVVYKSPQADLTSQGLVGTIDLRTIRPLDAGKRVLAVGARGTVVDQKLQPDSNRFGYRVYGTYVDQFADDSVGVALSASYTDEPYQTRDWNAWGYDKFDADHSLTTGVKTWVESSNLKRLGLNGTVQGRLSDSLTMTVDGFYSNFKEHVNQRGFEFPDFPAWGFSTLTNPQFDGGLVTGGTFNGVYANVENYAVDRDADLYSVGWNTAYDGHNGWKAFLDLSFSKTDRTDNSIETTLGSGYHQTGPSDNISFQWSDKGPTFTPGLDYSDPSVFVLTDLHGWGGSVNQAGYHKIRHEKDDLKQARAEIEREFGGFLDAVKVGASYIDRQKQLVADEAYLIPANGALTAAVPSDLLLSSVTMDRGIGPIVTYDPRELVGAGVLDEYTDATTLDRARRKAYDVKEKLFTPYIMGVIKADLGTTQLTGNIGVQAVHADQSSTGFAFVGGTPALVTSGDKYWTILPSMNLSFRMPNDVVVRFAAAREQMRPRLPDMRATQDYSYDTTKQILSGGGGNPLLRPYRASAVDLNVEKYFGSKGYVALQTFYKKIDRYIASGVTAFDYTGYPLPPNAPANTPTEGTYSGQVNTKGGNMYGAEFAGTLPFEVFSPALSGFGITGGAGYTKSKVKDFYGNEAPIAGYSKWVANLTAFYENSGFSLRGSMRYRSSFRGDFVDFDGNPQAQEVLGETVYDAQVGYDFPDTSSMRGLSVYLQGQNLTNTRQATTLPEVDPLAFMKYQTYGRRFVAGFTFKPNIDRAVPPPPAPVLPPPPPEVPAPATQTCSDGSVVLATDTCPVPPPPTPAPERG